jgi:hypothetical protein
MKQRIFRWSLVFIITASALVLVLTAAAHNLGEGRNTAASRSSEGSVKQEGLAKDYVEGAGYTSAGSRISNIEIGRGE